MYLDVFGLVTTGVGNLIDSPRAAQALPWRKSSGQQATPYEIAEEWHAVKGLAPGLGPAYYVTRTSLRLTDIAIDVLVAETLERNARSLATTFRAWPSWPADAQLGALSLTWAVGTSLVKWPKFSAACRDRDWDSAAIESEIRDGSDTATKTDDNPGIVRRNEQQLICFLNAGHVERNGLDRTQLHWPRRVDTMPAPPPTEPHPIISVPGGWNDPTERDAAQTEARDEYIRRQDDQ
jgi:hypothetical protein